MYVFISVLIVIAALFLVFIVVIQNSKGGGLAAGFSSSNQVMGVRKTTDFLEKGTWYLGAIIAVLCIAATFFIPGKGLNTNGMPESEIKKEIQEASPVANPNMASPFGSPAPEGGGQGQQPTQEPAPAPQPQK